MKNLTLGVLLLFVHSLNASNADPLDAIPLLTNPDLSAALNQDEPFLSLIETRQRLEKKDLNLTCKLKKHQLDTVDAQLMQSYLTNQLNLATMNVTVLTENYMF